VSGTVASALLASESYQCVKSIIEFGVNTGDTFKILRPDRYVGIDIAPKWLGEETARVITADVRTWESKETELFDLAICDAHGAVDSPDIEIITLAQIVWAKRLATKIAVDDCWVNGIATTALGQLGAPDEISLERDGFWIWRNNVPVGRS
jgi:hypothetical protein